MDRDPGDQRRASLRASDADRERFVEAFGQHHAEGRLTIEELSERTERAYAARTFGDLDALATDLPPLSPSPPTTRPAGSPDRPEPTALPPRMRPPGPERAAAKANLLRSILWYAALSLFLVVVWALSGSDNLLAGLAHPRVHAAGRLAVDQPLLPGRAVRRRPAPPLEALKPPSGPVRTMPVTRRVLPFSNSAVASR
jgi:hypothetical protein